MRIDKQEMEKDNIFMEIWSVIEKTLNRENILLIYTAYHENWLFIWGKRESFLSHAIHENKARI